MILVHKTKLDLVSYWLQMLKRKVEMTENNEILKAKLNM